MREVNFNITENRPLTQKVNLLRMTGDTAGIDRPGQFVILSIPGLFLRRPFSVCDRDENSFTLLVERVGEGTSVLQDLPVGTSLSVLTGLGNGFTAGSSGDKPLLIGGGSGLSPLFWLARELTPRANSPPFCWVLKPPRTSTFRKNSAPWASAPSSSPRTAAPAGKAW